MSRIEEIEARLSAIAAELEDDGADLPALEQEVRNLKEEHKNIMDGMEKREQIRRQYTETGETVSSDSF